MELTPISVAIYIKAIDVCRSAFVLLACLMLPVVFLQAQSSDLRQQGAPAEIQPTASPANIDLIQLEEQQFRSAVARVAPSVVQIETFAGLERVAGELVTDGPTTGTIVGEEGWIISSLFSFRQQPGSILVTMPDGKRASAKIVSRDHSRELALLKVETANPLPVATLAPRNSLQVGQWTLALGRTFNKEAVSQSVGVLSALDRAYGKAVQTDAKVSPVNYGGPLIDIDGRVIGVLAPISPGAILEGDSSQIYDSGIGFAVPMQDILDRLPRMKSGEDIHAGKLGIVSSQQNELAGPVKILGATPGSPAGKVGLRSGDIVVQAENRPVELLAHLRQALGRIDAGMEFHFSVRRRGRTLDLETTLAHEIPIYEMRFLGIRAKESESGVEVTHIDAGSPASKSPIEVGWAVSECNGESIKSVRDLRVVLAVAELDVPLKLSGKKGAGPTGTIPVSAGTWPSTLPELPPEGGQARAEVTAQVIALPLGDFPNKSAAIVPSSAANQTSGVVIVLPEPGEVDQNKFSALWEAIAKKYGWIVAFVASANPQRWSLEEAELSGRVLSKLNGSYKIDPSRTAIVGLGSGGRMALLASQVLGEKIAGVATVGTGMDGFNLRQPNSPLQSLRFLMIGDDSVVDAAQRMRKLGYPVIPITETGLDVSKWETVPMESLTRWLSGLDRI